MSFTSNVIIQNNKIGQGGYTNGSGTNTAYNYDNCLRIFKIFGSSVIEGNTFTSVNAGNDMLRITDCNCIIQNNKFIRNNTAINAYIGNYTLANDYSTDINNGNHIIINNIFDSTVNGTFDGYETQLCKGLVPTTIYTRNKNQTGTTAIPLFNDGWEFSTPTFSAGPSLNVYGTSQNGLDLSALADGSNFVTIRRQQNSTAYNHKLNLITRFGGGASATPTLLWVRRSFMFRDFIQEGVTFNYAKIGAYCPIGTITNFSDSFFKVSVVAHTPAFSMDATKYSSNPSFDSGGAFTLVEYNKTVDSTAFSDMQLGTVYNDITGFGFGGFTPGNFFGFKYPDLLSSTNGYLIEIFFEVKLHFDDAYTILFTPIEVGYQW